MAALASGVGRKGGAGKAQGEGSAGSRAVPDWDVCALDRDAFVELVRAEGARRYRDLPWRNIGDAYAVLVSEVMLQQTQVSRVQRYWQRWLDLFPTVDALASADTAAVLEMWQGLGYNRRAIALKRACEQCSAQHAGELPRTVAELVALPGIGPATAAGIVAFAYDEPAVYIETNVRSVFLHELFPGVEGVSDKQLAPYVADTCPAGAPADPSADAAGMREGSPRAWYYALLDYGAYLKKQVANPSRRSSHYARQSAFEGSRRQKRSFILKMVLASPDGVSRAEIARALDDAEVAAARQPVDAALFNAVLSELLAEGFFREEGDLLVP